MVRAGGRADSGALDGREPERIHGRRGGYLAFNFEAHLMPVRQTYQMNAPSGNNGGQNDRRGMGFFVLHDAPFVGVVSGGLAMAPGSAIHHAFLAALA